MPKANKTKANKTKANKTKANETKANEIPEGLWQHLQQHLGYSGEEMELFRNNPRNRQVLACGQKMLSSTIVFEVVESHGCNGGHTVGTRFFFSGEGNLLTRMAPSRVCAFALPIMTQMIFGMQELWYAGADPNQLCFKRAGCFDVGVRCGGWGHIVIEAQVIERQQALELYQGRQE